MSASQEAGMLFRKVRVSTRIRGSTLRNPAGAKVSRTGLTELNVAGTEDLVALATDGGYDPQRMAVTYGVEDEAQNIAVYMASPEDPGAVAVKLNKKNRTVNLYLDDLFDKVSKLRPTAVRRCLVSRTVDAEGQACLVISLNASLRTGHSGRREGSGAQSAAKETEAK